MTVEDKESLLLMREASMIMSQTLNDVLSIQRIEEGQVELVLQPFLIKDFISNILLLRTVNLRKILFLNVVVYLQVVVKVLL